MKEFESDRIKLVAPSLNYLEEFYLYASKPNIGPMAGWMPHQNLLESKHILEEMAKSRHTWFIVWKENNEFIGTIDLRPLASVLVFKITNYEIGYSLNDTYWGLGIAVEASNLLIDYAFKELKAKEIEVSHTEQNIQSKRVIEKLGFVFRKAEYREEYRTYTHRMWFYSMTKYDYERRKKHENITAKI